MDGGNLLFLVVVVIMSICFIGALFNLIISLTALCDTAKRYLESKIEDSKQ